MELKWEEGINSDLEDAEGQGKIFFRLTVLQNNTEQVSVS